MVKSVQISGSLAAILVVGCHGKEQAVIENPVMIGVVASQAKNPSDPNSPEVQKRKTWEADFAQARLLAEKGTPQEGKEAEVKIKALMAEYPLAGRPYLVLAQMYQRHSELPRAVDMYEQFLEHRKRYERNSFTSVAPNEWYGMYTAFKEAGHEQDARKALINVIKGQNIDRSVRYDDASQAPPVAAIRIAEYLVARSKMWGSKKEDFNKGVEHFAALADKEGMTPKMLMDVAGLMEYGDYREKRLEVYKRVALTNSPEAAKAKKELVVFGVTKSTSDIRPGVKIPAIPNTVKPAKGWQH